MVVSSIRLTAWLANSKKRVNGREIDVWWVTAIISALVICIIVCLSWAVNHYQDNAITYKAQRDKNAREPKLANAVSSPQMRHADVAALDAKIHEGVSRRQSRKWCSRDDVAGRRRLHISSLSVSAQAKLPPPSAGIMQPPDWWHRWTGLFHPQREADHYAKTTGRNPEVY